MKAESLQQTTSNFWQPIKHIAITEGWSWTVWKWDPRRKYSQDLKQSWQN